ncbi:Origin recognition complex subunit 6 [Cytospora mali]|uniref:Origin recognition complex subunit 6 n=1 Tax=Cytospora mali TaxID=578113 RepID=A0A194V401_CYTMA|nr:Origin recognition complex subunit 6 [Valsa mali var. pyri (nom. inval.)]
MSRPVEQALFSLLPSQNSDLPPPLLELASSLLALSRHKASTLKAEEEIARLYACCHLACDRLKISLNLPPIEPRPPIPPRIYKRLYTVLDKVLPNSSTPGRPRATGLGTSRSRVPTRGTPTKESSLASFRTPGKAGTPSRLNLHGTSKTQDSTLPPWLRPTVRHLCTSLASNGGPDLAPTVIAGLESIIAPYRRRTEDEWINSHMTTLVAAIYWYVFMSASLAPGEDMTAQNSKSRYTGTRKGVLGSLRKAREDVKTPLLRGRKGESTEQEEVAFWEGWQDTIKAADVDEAVTEVANRGWLNSDWYRSIDFLREKGEGEVGQPEDGLEENITTTAVAVQIRKADAMLQDKFDYLSERRRAEYRQWKAGVQLRIKRLERSKAEEAMQVDP